MKLLGVTSTLALWLLVLPESSAWGGLGHETVAFIASEFVSDSTTSFFQNALGDSSADYLAKVATWADSYRYTKAGRWSAPLHFIDSKDSPPDSCSVSYDRDCPAHGCVVSAIQNYTSRVVDGSLSDTERGMAAKFLVHFVGDVHQPLHDEGLDRGGNSIKVRFNGKKTNLHSVWDTSIPEKIVGGYSLEDARGWATTISTAIRSGEYKSQAAGWVTDMNVLDPISTAMTWATDANQFVCSTVMPNGPDALEGQDLGSDYYDTAAPVVQLQIAKAGYRHVSPVAAASFWWIASQHTDSFAGLVAG